MAILSKVLVMTKVFQMLTYFYAKQRNIFDK